MNYNHTQWSLKCDPSQLKNTESLPAAPSNTGHKAAVIFVWCRDYSIVSLLLTHLLHIHTVPLPIFLAEIGKYSKETLFTNDLQVLCALTLISKCTASTVLDCFLSLPMTLLLLCHSPVPFPLSSQCTALLIWENSLVQ